MANRSGGQYFNIDSTVNNGGKIVDALQRIFNQIQAVNSVFTSASLPVSTTTRGTYQNQVFLGMFRPDQDARPRFAHQPIEHLAVALGHRRQRRRHRANPCFPLCPSSRAS
jgi:hypothetical protein